MEKQYVLVSTFRNADGTFSVGGTRGPFPSRAEAELAKAILQYPSPEWVYIRPLHSVDGFGWGIN